VFILGQHVLHLDQQFTLGRSPKWMCYSSFEWLKAQIYPAEKGLMRPQGTTIHLAGGRLGRPTRGPTRQVLSGSTQIQGVFSGAFVTGTFALNLVHPSSRVFHASPLPKGLAALRRVTRRPKRKPPPFLRMHTARAPACRRGTTHLQDPPPTGLGGTVCLPSREGLCFGGHGAWHCRPAQADDHGPYHACAVGHHPQGLVPDPASGAAPGLARRHPRGQPFQHGHLFARSLAVETCWPF
jgi:hypothetical protein